MTDVHLTATTTSKPVGDAEHWYWAWVPAERVPAAHRQFVERTARRMARRLRLPAISVRFFEPMPSTPVPSTDVFTSAVRDGSVFVGVAPNDQPWTIGIDIGFRGTEGVTAVVAHEVRHCAQLWGDVRTTDPEGDADRFAAGVLGAT